MTKPYIPVSTLLEHQNFHAKALPDPNCSITCVYCCDLLSFAMSRAPEHCAWVSVMSNINTLAVASLCEAAVVVIAENAEIDSSVSEKAMQEGINLIATPLPVFEAALEIHNCLMKGGDFQ